MKNIYYNFKNNKVLIMVAERDPKKQKENNVIKVYVDAEITLEPGDYISTKQLPYFGWEVVKIIESKAAVVSGFNNVTLKGKFRTLTPAELKQVEPKKTKEENDV